MKIDKIFLLTDYKGHFGSKHFDVPYRSGFSKDLLIQYFERAGIAAEAVPFADLDLSPSSVKGKAFLYTSSEDIGYHYKTYIEDIVLGIETAGGMPIPQFKYLRANNNKVLMEILRLQSGLDAIKSIKSNCYGTLEELLKDERLRTSAFPKVLKLSEGASGRNVQLARDYRSLVRQVKRMCRTRHVFEDIWDYGRSLKHKGYIRESLYRKKYVVQDFVPNLANDWKVYVFYDSYFVFYRPVFRSRKFKASGGGYDNYAYGLKANIPDGLLDFAKRIRDIFDVPQMSLDIGWNGKEFYLFEFQFVYFGTAGIVYSSEYFTCEDGSWTSKNNSKDQEFFYVNSVVKYLNNR